jgi:Fibronectin type III domain
VTAGTVTETTVKIEFELNPGNSETTYEVEYGPTEGYGQKTEQKQIAANAGPQRVKETITGLEAGRTYYFRVVATNAQAKSGVKSDDEHFTTTEGQSGGGGGSQSGSGVSSGDSPTARQGVSAFQSSSNGGATLGSLPPPVLGKTVNVDVVSGKVFVALPGAHAASAAAVLGSGLVSSLAAIESLSKGLHFIPLTEARQIPVGSVLETTGGVVGITTATTASREGKLQSGDFGGGIFKLLQNRKQKGLTDLDIVDNHSASQVCASVGKRGKGRAYAAKLSSKTLGRVNASGHGHFAVRGQYSAATVRGTVWSVANRCEGTLTHVTRGVVSVRDFVRRRTITLFTGESYLARTPIARR